MPAPPDYAVAAVAVRRSHPSAPVLETLDLVMRGRHVGVLDPAESWLAPTSPFGEILADAFDFMSGQAWATFIRTAPGSPQPLLQLWPDAVLRPFVQRYGGSLL